MVEIERIERELREGVERVTRGPFIVVPATSKGEPADIYMARNEDGIYEGWVGEMASVTDAEHFACCSPENIRALLSELSRLRGVEAKAREVLEPFARVLSQIETQGQRGTWLGSMLDKCAEAIDVHPFKKNGPAREIPDDFLIIVVGVEFYGGVSLDGLLMSDFRAARAFLHNGGKE